MLGMVRNIDRRLAVLGNGETIEFNKACLAMGSRPYRPPVAGVGLNEKEARQRRLWNLRCDDARLHCTRRVGHGSTCL